MNAAKMSVRLRVDEPREDGPARQERTGGHGE